MPRCPSCGNEVKSNEKFCRKCGTKLVTVALQQPSKSNQSKYILVLVAVVILVGGWFWYDFGNSESEIGLEKERLAVEREKLELEKSKLDESTVQSATPATVTVSREIILVGEEFTTQEYGTDAFPEQYSISPSSYYAVQHYIDLTNMESPRIEGRIHAEHKESTGDYSCFDCMAFYVFDNNNFNSWKGGGSYAAYVSYESNHRDTYLDFGFVPDKTGYYFFVYKNLESDNVLVPEVTVKLKYITTKTVT